MLHGDILLMIDSWLPLSHMLVYKILNQHMCMRFKTRGIFDIHMYYFKGNL